jgi:putative endopeptidase
MRRRSFLPCCALILAAAAAFGQESLAHQPALDASSLDKSFDPCIDFYQYSCGGWRKKNPIPPDQTSWDVPDKLQNQTLAVLRDILVEAAVPFEGRNSAQQKIGDYYAACMDEDAIDSAGLHPLESELHRIDHLQSKDGIAEVAAAMTYEGALFDFHSTQDYKDSSKVIAEIDQDGLSLPDRDFYLLQDPKSRKLRQAYRAHVQRMFMLLGDDAKAASGEVLNVVRIETALAKASLSRVDRRDPGKLDHPMSRRQLRTLSPAFAWEQYFAATGISALPALNVATPGFFKALSAELNRHDLNDWKSYLRWHVTHANATHLSKAFRDADFDFYGKTLQGAQEIEPRWKRCVIEVDSGLGEALGQVYVERSFSPEARQRALRMVKQIEDAMGQDIESLPWMTAGTKLQALEKLRAVANKIGYPDKWRDYGAVTIASDDEMGNVLRVRDFEFHRQVAKVGKPVDRREWTMTPPTANAYYDAQLNDINFPAGILQPPLLDPDSDDAPNYGDTGSTIGHELTHGFDDEGRQFDARGNLRDWWTGEDAKQFQKRAGCVANQYSQYTVVDRLKINGKLTLGENVADLGGLMLAYRAWQQQTKGEELKPIEGFTPSQRFFIGYAQSWCANIREETKRLRVMADPHSPDEFRTNGVVSNMPEFQQAFHCAAGTPMVRKEACRVW